MSIVLVRTPSAESITHCLSSAYHVTPASFADALARLHQSLRQVGREPASFPHALGSMLYYLTEGRRLAEEILGGVLISNPLEKCIFGDTPNPGREAAPPAPLLFSNTL